MPVHLLTPTRYTANIRKPQQLPAPNPKISQTPPKNPKNILNRNHQNQEFWKYRVRTNESIWKSSSKKNPQDYSHLFTNVRSKKFRNPLKKQNREHIQLRNFFKKNSGDLEITSSHVTSLHSSDLRRHSLVSVVKRGLFGWPFKSASNSFWRVSLINCRPALFLLKFSGRQLKGGFAFEAFFKATFSEFCFFLGRLLRFVFVFPSLLPTFLVLFFLDFLVTGPPPNMLNGNSASGSGCGYQSGISGIHPKTSRHLSDNFTAIPFSCSLVFSTSRMQTMLIGRTIIATDIPLACPWVPKESSPISSTTSLAATQCFIEIPLVVSLGFLEHFHKVRTSPTFATSFLFPLDFICVRNTTTLPCLSKKWQKPRRSKSHRI